MRFSPERIGILFIALVIFGAAPVLAQNNEAEFTVTGSAIVQPLLQALVEASDVSASFNIEVTGTNTGFSTFCAGESDMTTATRPISVDETAICSDNGIAYVELVLAQDILAFVVHPEADFAVCLTGEELTTVYAPSSEAEISTWNQVLGDGPEDLALSVFAPDEFSPEFAVLDRLVEGDGIRADAVSLDNSAAIISAVSDTPGAIGLVPLPDAQAVAASVRILELDAAAVQGCQEPSSATAEDDLYPAADKFYLYVNASQLNQSELESFLSFAINAQELVIEAGYSPMTELAVANNLQNLEAALSGEVAVVISDTGYDIFPGTAGQVTVGGSGEGADLVDSATEGLNVIAANISVSGTYEGLPAGFRRFCNGELDLVLAYRDMQDDEALNCEANNITPLTLPLGERAVVVISNAETEYLDCLTTESLTSIWAAGSDETLMQWNEVNSAFPDIAMTLFAPLPGDASSDLLLLSASGSSLIEKVATEQNSDPLYRAAAVANVDASLTYMTWQEYQRVLANNQANIALVAVDGGNGCVMPDLNSIRGGSYPLARLSQIIVNRSQLIRPELQSLLWLAFGDSSLSSFEEAGFVGIRVSDLSQSRSILLENFNAVAAEVQAASLIEATEEADPDATAEATAEESGE